MASGIGVAFFYGLREGAGRGVESVAYLPVKPRVIERYGDFVREKKKEFPVLLRENAAYLIDGLQYADSAGLYLHRNAKHVPRDELAFLFHSRLKSLVRGDVGYEGGLAVLRDPSRHALSYLEPYGLHLASFFSERDLEVEFVRLLVNEKKRAGLGGHEFRYRAHGPFSDEFFIERGYEKGADF